MRKKLLSMLTLLIVATTSAFSQGKVTLKEGTADANKWTVKTGTTTVVLGTTEVAKDAPVTATYSGQKHVKSVKAVVKAAAPATTITWNFSEMSGHYMLNMGYTNNGVTLSGEGELLFGSGILAAMGSCTFTAPTGKHFKSIVITATQLANINGSGWTNGGDLGNYTSTWTGDASSVSFSGMADRVTSIVFTLE